MTPPRRPTRRTVLRSTAAVAAAATLTAKSYARVVGANDRINLGLIGCGGRGVHAHLPGIEKHAKAENVVFTAVSDPWKIAAQNAATAMKEKLGVEPRQYTSYREILALADVDAVMIASPDHVHTTHLKATAEAKKDCYVEKPIATEFEALKAAVDAVKKSGIVCQVGTQTRSMPSMAGARKVYQSGVLGTVARIEQSRNGTRPYWYGYIKPEVKEADVDWKEFQGDMPPEKFDPIKFSAWMGYRGYCDGPVPQLGVHYLDLVHYITGATFPTSCVCMGGTFTWKDEHKFTTPDHVESIWTYPEGFMVHYSSNFGNGGANSFKFLGDQGTLDCSVWASPVLTADGGGTKNRGIIRGKTEVQPVPQPDHFLDFLQCLRSRKTPNAPIDAGYQHAVAAIMSVRAMDSGKRQVYDREKREIREG
ncbi:MAG TPA: Gfo/Idh/MocA family oxidoreductase [Tepidisphaeraceae bacterium]|nr:Gfo/Idh/MocA family oxidoreductase [Tepidisphaeraceae bacterium]